MRSLSLLFTALALLRVAHSQCSLSFTLPNIIKDVVTLTYNSGDEQDSSYPYFPSMFSSNPKVAYSISQLDITTNSSIVYYLDLEEQTMMFTFYFNAPKQMWTRVTVNLWITSRNDLIVSTLTFKNIAPGQTQTQSINLTSNPNTTITANAKHLLFITGIASTLISSNFSVNVTAGPTNPTAATVSAFSGLSTLIMNMTVTSVIFDPMTSQFLSYVGTITYKSFSSQFLNLYSNFVPIYYFLLGVNSFSITGSNTKNFGYSLSLTNSTVLNLQTSQSSINFDTIAFSYLTIGLQNANVCKDCGNTYIADGGCLDVCPADTYPYSFPSGGKACLECPSIAGLKLNDLGNGCSCLPGYELLTTHQCIAMSSIPTNCTGLNVIQNGTTCICSPGTYNISGLCQTCPNNTAFNGSQCIQTTSCPANSTFSSDKRACICNSGFMNISGACMACQSGQYYNAQLLTCTCTMFNQVVGPTGTCVCQTGYYNVSGFCIQCPSDTVYVNGTCAPTGCPENQILSNGKCVCDSFSVKKGSACERCGSGTFPDTNNNVCSNCIPNCANCTNARSCQVCNINYIFDFSSLTCIPLESNTSSKVSITAGFPVLTPTAFVIDFTINSPATLSNKSAQQLANMIKINYPSSQPKPYRTIYKQSPTLNRIRVTFDYRCLLPSSSFVVSFSFVQSSIALNSTVNATFSMTSGQLTLNIPE